MGVLRSKLFTEGDESVTAKLEDCATGQPSEARSHFNTTTNASGEHIRRVQEALKKIQSVDENLQLPPFSANGQYDESFAKAIFAYKNSRSIRNYSNKVDNVIGIKTIRKLDEELAQADPAPPPSPPTPAPRDVVDFVINFKGSANEAILDASHALYDRLIPLGYKPRFKFSGKYKPAIINEIMVDENTKRHLIRLARSTNTISTASEDLFSRVSFYMLLAMGALHLKPGRIFIHGSSSGGRNAIDFAAHLSRLGMVPHFVGVVDGAYFQEDTQSRPADVAPHDRTSTVPVFNVNVGATPRARCHNWYQTLGNHVSTTFALNQKIFTSSMNGEVHGKMLGFATNRSVDEDVPHQNTISDSDAHSECCRIGNEAVHNLVGVELRLLPPK